MWCVLEQEREIQKSYWMEQAAELTLEAMMLDSEASDLDKEDRPEVHFSAWFLLFFSQLLPRPLI